MKLSNIIKVGLVIVAAIFSAGIFWSRYLSLPDDVSSNKDAITEYKPFIEVVKMRMFNGG